LIGIYTRDYLITDAGFRADIGAERFFNINGRVYGLVPDAAVVVTTIRALKAQSGADRIIAGRPLPLALLEENPEDVRAGAANLVKKIENVRLHGVTSVIAVNAFPDDFPSEHRAIREIATSLGARCAVRGARCAVTTHFADGGAWATELAHAVAEPAEEPGSFALLYPLDAPLRAKIEGIATRVYGADGVDYSPAAARTLDRLESHGFGGSRRASPRPTCRSRRIRR
jgi:formate--tetrahydrofolate ligase